MPDKKPVVIRLEPAVVQAKASPTKVVTGHGKFTAPSARINGQGEVKPGIMATRNVVWMRSGPNDDWEVRVTGQDGSWLDLGVGDPEDAILDVATSLLPPGEEG